MVLPAKHECGIIYDLRPGSAAQVPSSRNLSQIDCPTPSFPVPSSEFAQNRGGLRRTLPLPFPCPNRQNTRMSKKTLNEINLEALGAARLAALLMEVSTGSAEIKRRLRLELSHSLGAAELAHEVRKRLVSLRKSSSFISWRKRRALIKDLSVQTAMIVDKIAPDDAPAAFDLLWQLIDLAPSIYGRVDDSKGEVAEVFGDAIAHFEHIAPLAQQETESLAVRIWAAIQDNSYGEWDGIIALLAPALGAPGLAALKAHVQAFAEAPLDAASEDHEAIQFLRQLRGGSSYRADRKARVVKGWLQEIATASGDTSGYIATHSAQDLRSKRIAADVATLLLADGQAHTALDLLLDADLGDHPADQEAWDVCYIACLTTLERVEDAQAHRWACFTETLDAGHLRDFLKLLPDFDDVEAEQSAKDHVLGFPAFATALTFCINWPDLLTATALIEARLDEVNGDHATLLAPAAEALRARHPLAAVKLWRTMVDAALEQGRAARYAQAADHLTDCAAADAFIDDYADTLCHGDYVQGLQRRHGGKSSFWAKMH